MEAKGIIYAVMAACIAGGAFVGGCSTSDRGAQVEAMGVASLPLTTVGPDGIEYRLDAATFTISDAESTTLVSGEEESLEVNLATGDYSISLADGWQLVAIVDGVPTPVEAELLSPNPQTFTIEDEVTTDIVYRFGVDGMIIELGEGTAHITIEVEELPDCPEGQGLCDGACVDILSDPAHCGSSCTQCSSSEPQCYEGDCVQCTADSDCETTGYGSGAVCTANACQCRPPSASNVLQNPGFDGSASGWTLNGSASYTTTDVDGCSGSGSVQLGQLGDTVRQCLPAQPNMDYYLAYRFKASGGPTSAGTATCYAAFLPAGNNCSIGDATGSFDAIQSYNNDNWIQGSASGTSAANTTHILVVCSSAASAGYYDQLYLGTSTPGVPAF